MPLKEFCTQLKEVHMYILSGTLLFIKEMKGALMVGLTLSKHDLF
jgi:hypothetical protein